MQLAKITGLTKIKGNIISLVYDNEDIETFLKRINGVYRKLVWVLQVNTITKEKKEFLVHNNNGFINEYALLYINNKKIA